MYNTNVILIIRRYFIFNRNLLSITFFLEIKMQTFSLYLLFLFHIFRKLE